MSLAAPRSDPIAGRCRNKKARKNRPSRILTGWKAGGAEEIRTPDPHNAIVVLYQLSYDPMLTRVGI